MKRIFQGVLSFESRFKSTKLGMKEYDYLSRGSALLCLHKDKVGIATCTHIAHPFSTPYYYQANFLNHVTPNDMQFEISTFNSKELIWKRLLDPKQMIIHHSLDVCLFLLDYNDFFSNIPEECKNESFYKIIPFKEEKNSIFEVSEGDPIICLGYDYSADDERPKVTEFRGTTVLGELLIINEQALRKQIGRNLPESNLVKMKEFVAVTQTKLNAGMCGGAVVLENDPTQVVGMVEGINQYGHVHGIPIETIWSLFEKEDNLTI